MEIMENQSSQISDLLLHALDDLTQENFKRFKDKLLHIDFKGKDKRKDKIPQGHLENADRIDTTNLLIQFYAGDDAVDVSIEVFTLINLRDAAAKLREGKEGKKRIELNIRDSFTRSLFTRLPEDKQ